MDVLASQLAIIANAIYACTAVEMRAQLKQVFTIANYIVVPTYLCYVLLYCLFLLANLAIVAFHCTTYVPHSAFQAVTFNSVG